MLIAVMLLCVRARSVALCDPRAKNVLMLALTHAGAFSLTWYIGVVDVRENVLPEIMLAACTASPGDSLSPTTSVSKS